MNDDRPERRRYKRAYFSKQDSLVGILKLSDYHEASLTADVKDLSEGGIGFALKRDLNHKIVPGNRLTIKKIQGTDHLGFINNLKMKVIWILDIDELEYVGFGCEFLGMPQAAREKIRNYVKAWAKSGTRV